MRYSGRQALLLVAMVLIAIPAFAQAEMAAHLAELGALSNKVGAAETRVRVEAFHRVWTIALDSDSSLVKIRALELMAEPVGSASDHIRMPAVYAISEVANSTRDAQVKLKALATLREPMMASQLPIRNATIDAVNSIVRAVESIARGTDNDEVISAALSLLAEPVRSGNNGVRIPAIHAVMRAVEHAPSDRVCNQALELLTAPLESAAMIGGMEVRLMAVVAVERIGVLAQGVAVKSRALGVLSAYGSKSGWEPEARERARFGAARVQGTVREPGKAPKDEAARKTVI